MDPQVIPLMVDVVEERLEKDVMAYQPEEENRRFILGVDKTVVMIDEEKEVFVPLNRGESITYLDLKGFLKELDLIYRSRTEYKRN